MGRELELVNRQRMLLMPYNNGMRAIPLEPHQTVTRWMHVRSVHGDIKNKRFTMVLPSEMCRTLRLKARDTLKIKLDRQDGKKFLVLTRQKWFTDDMALHGKPSIHLVARPVTADGRVDETCPCIRKILPYADAATRLGGMEIYDAGEFAGEIEAHLRTAGPSHLRAPETVRTGTVPE